MYWNKPPTNPEKLNKVKNANWTDAANIIRLFEEYARAGGGVNGYIKTEILESRHHGDKAEEIIEHVNALIHSQPKRHITASYLYSYLHDIKTTYDNPFPNGDFAKTLNFILEHLEIRKNEEIESLRKTVGSAYAGYAKYALFAAPVQKLQAAASVSSFGAPTYRAGNGNGN